MKQLPDDLPITGDNRTPHQRPLYLGDWRIYPELNRLMRGEEVVQLEPKAMGVLLCLCDARGEMVHRNTLLERVWNGRHVTDYVLSRCISSLRKALGDDARKPRFIETVRQGGYRLLAMPQTQPHPDAESHPHDLHSRKRPKRVRDWGLVLAAFLAILFWLVWQTAEDPSPHYELRPITALLGNEVDPAISPDGQRLVFAWDGPEENNFNLYQKWLDRDDLMPLTDLPGEEKNPAWSPDGQWVGFVYAGERDQGIYRVSSLGGAPRLIVTTVSGDIPDLAWSPDGRYLYFPDRPSPEEPYSVFRFDLQLRQKERVTHPPVHYFGDRDLALSADGRYLAIARAEVTGVEKLWLHDLEERTSRLLSGEEQSVLGIGFLPGTSGLVYGVESKSGSKLAFRDWDTGASRDWTGFGDNGNDPHVSLSGNLLIFERKEFQVNVWQVKREGATWSVPRRIVSSTKWDSFSGISPDGTRICFVSNRNGMNGIWVADSERPEPAGFVTALQSYLAAPPIFVPDNRSLVYADRIGGAVDLVTVAIAGGPPRRYLKLPGNEIPSSWSGSGTSLYFGSDRSGSWEIWRYDRTDGEVARITHEGGVHAQESPDGRWLFISRPKQNGLWKIPLAGGKPELVMEELSAGYRRVWDLFEDGVVFFSATRFTNQEKPIYFHRFTSGETFEMTEPMPWLGFGNVGLRAAPDRETIYFSKLDRLESDLWMVEVRDAEVFLKLLKNEKNP